MLGLPMLSLILGLYSQSLQSRGGGDGRKVLGKSFLEVLADCRSFPAVEKGETLNTLFWGGVSAAHTSFGFPGIHVSSVRHPANQAPPRAWVRV